MSESPASFREESPIGEERLEKLFGRPGTKMEWKPITTSPFG